MLIHDIASSMVATCSPSLRSKQFEVQPASPDQGPWVPRASAAPGSPAQGALGTDWSVG